MNAKKELLVLLEQVNAKMNSASNKFVMHSYRYYGGHLPRHGHDACLVRGLFRQAADEALKRGLIKVDLKTNRYVEVPDELA